MAQDQAKEDSYTYIEHIFVWLKEHDVVLKRKFAFFISTTIQIQKYLLSLNWINKLFSEENNVPRRRSRRLNDGRVRHLSPKQNSMKLCCPLRSVCLFVQSWKQRAAPYLVWLCSNKNQDLSLLIEISSNKLHIAPLSDYNDTYEPFHIFVVHSDYHWTTTWRHMRGGWRPLCSTLVITLEKEKWQLRSWHPFI